VAEAIKLLNSCGYYILVQNKHPIYATDNEKLISQRKARYALTITKDPLRQGTLKGLRDFLGFSSWAEMHNFWIKIK
jgi:hypothetical protein